MEEFNYSVVRLYEQTQSSEPDLKILSIEL